MSVCNSTAEFAITDGTTRISLVNCPQGIAISDWVPYVPGPKDGGIWRSSPLSDGRALADWKWENWMESLALTISKPSQDRTIRWVQDLQRLLVKAHQYWTTSWQDEPVWLEVRARRETNTRYAVVKGWRTPAGSGNPFAQPFVLPDGQAVIEQYELNIEHGPWLADEPGTSTCVQVSGLQSWCFPWHLEFDGTDSRVDISDNAVIQNLPASTSHFTAEAWIRADGWGESNVGRIFDKIGAGSPGWFLRVNSAHGIDFFADFNNVDMRARSGLDDFTADGEWHHVLATCRNPLGTAALPRIWVDGTEVSYTQQDTGVNAYGGDIGDDLYIGNDNALGSTFDGGIGWCRLSTGERFFNPTHTVPPRCTLPDIDGNTIGQWIGEGGDGSTSVPNQEGTAAIDGTPANCTFDCSCDNDVGRTATCDAEVYIANKNNEAQLTHVYVDDGGVFGANLLFAALPYNLLPAVPAVNDAVYFGIDTSNDDTGPFCSLVFDISTAISDVTTLNWEYWNGAWVALTVQDNTDADGAMSGVAFDTTGVGSVHWEHPSDWAETTVNGITGWWVRAEVAAIGAAPTAPTQQNRDPYTIVWNDIDIDDAQVGGDITALLNAQYEDVSDSDGVSPVLDATRLIQGLRSVDRGDNFRAYLNCANEQNPTGITVTIGGATTLAAYVESPTGIAARFNPAGVDAMAARVQFAFTGSLSQEYFGVFRAFVRCTQSGGSSGDFTMRLSSQFISTSVTYETVTVDGTVADECVDMGLITLPPAITSIASGETVGSGSLSIECANSNAAPGDLYLLDLILIPVDENAVEALYDPVSAFTRRKVLSVDSITVPKTNIRSVIFDTGDIDGIWQTISPASALLQSNEDQRIWSVAMKHDGAWPSSLWTSKFEISLAPQLFATWRYLYARGAR